MDTIRQGQYGAVREMSRDVWLANLQARWMQGEHVALVGPTGTGKTGLASDVVSLRTYVAVLAIKRKDDTISMFKGYKIIKQWPPPYDDNHVILWLKPKTLQDIGEQRVRIVDAMERIYVTGGWCVYFDDLSYVCEHLRIKTPVVTLLNQGRALGISAVCSVQRPRNVPPQAFNQARHIIQTRYDDERELERVAEIVGQPKRRVLELNQELAVYPKGYTDFVSYSKGQIAIVRNQVKK